MSMSIWEWITIISVVVFNFYLYGTCFYFYLSKRGVKTCRPRVPYFGNFNDVLRRKKNLMQAIDTIYKKFPGERYVGFFEFVQEIIVLKDAELIRKVCVEAADHFLDHRKIVSEDEASLFNKHLFSLKGQKWRDMRAAMGPAFGSTRMKGMFPLVFKCSENITSHLVQLLTNHKNSDVHKIELKSLYSRHINDVIALCVYACEENTLKNPRNEIYSNGQIISKTSFLQFANIMAYSNKFFKTLNFMKPDERACIFFRGLVSRKMKERELNGKTGDDFLQYLIDVKKGSARNDTRKISTGEIYTLDGSFKREWTDDDFLAQALCFYIGGLNTIASLLTFLSYELAVNSSIQTKLQKEIDQANIECNYKPTYEKITNLEYLDMVVSETLRKWPPVIATDRECVKPYTLPPANENAKVYTFLSKYSIWIPIYSIHHDPEHFPNPEVFDPERFSKHNKDNIKPYTFIPFGAGVRNCIGSKFALSVAKTTVFHLMSKIDFVPISKTAADLKVENDGLNLKPKDDCWVGITLRN